MTTNKQDELRGILSTTIDIATPTGALDEESKSNLVEHMVGCVSREVIRVLSELKTHKNKATDTNLGLHGRRDCKSCSLVEDLEAFIEAKRKEYGSE